jgi:hypothetical protein
MVMAINSNSFSAINDALSTTKEVATGVGKIMGMIFDVLGFIGFRVFLLLFITAFFLWFLNLISPLSKKLNYFIGICVGLLVAASAKLAFNPFILKYLIIILSPLVISYILLYTIKLIRLLIKKLSYNIKDFVLHTKVEQTKKEKLLREKEKQKRKNKIMKNLYIANSGVARFRKGIKF